MPTNMGYSIKNFGLILLNVMNFSFLISLTNQVNIHLSYNNLYQY